MPQPDTPKMLQAIGGALHNWSLVELNLAKFFSALANMTPTTKGHIIFNAIISFDTRLAVCNALVVQDEGIEALDKEIWFKLSARLSKQYKKRHQLAHFTLGTGKS